MQYLESVNGYYYKVSKSGQKTRISKSVYDRRTQQVGGNGCKVEIVKRTIYTQNQEGIHDAHFLQINGTKTDIVVEVLLNSNNILEDMREDYTLNGSILEEAQKVCKTITADQINDAVVLYKNNSVVASTKNKRNKRRSRASGSSGEKKTVKKVDRCFAGMTTTSPYNAQDQDHEHDLYLTCRCGAYYDNPQNVHRESKDAILTAMNAEVQKRMHHNNGCKCKTLVAPTASELDSFLRHHGIVLP